MTAQTVPGAGVDKFLGCIVGAAAGDALGAATEMRTREQIEARFGGPVTTFVVPPEDTFAGGNRAGQVTDDFSLAYYLARAIVAGGGVDAEVARRAVLAWADDERFFARFAGPTTRLAVGRMRGDVAGPRPAFPTGEATNGAAMKAWPVGLVNAGDADGAVRDAVVVALPTHDNNLAIAGASAIAAAVSHAATPGADLDGVVRAALAGARKGDELGRQAAHTVAGPSVLRRMELAIDIGRSSRSLEDAMTDLADVVGTGLHAAEAVPAALGLVVAADADPVAAIHAAVNAGNDTDTVATMVGAIVGALHGAAALPAHYLQVLTAENGWDLVALAEDLWRTGRGRRG
jgi:ADP-ribosylglycohydrolase